MNLFAIWDIDNCIADDFWRQERIEWDKDGDERYRAYNDVLEDDVFCHRKEFDLLMAMGATPVFFTGRSEYLRNKTERWLWRQRGLVKPIMYMRPNDGRMTPKDLKEQMLTKFRMDYLGFGNRIIGAFDDLPPVVQMYRENNIPAAQLAIHADLTGAYKPADLKL